MPKAEPGMPSRRGLRLWWVHSASSRRKPTYASGRGAPSSTSSATAARAASSRIGARRAPSAAAALRSFASSAPGRGRSSKASRLVWRSGIAANRRSSSGAGAAGRPMPTRTSRLGPAGAGSSPTRGSWPRWRRARQRCRRHAPHLIVSSRSAGSPTGRARVRSAYSSTRSPARRKRHGWALCPDGARTACSTAKRSMPAAWPGIESSPAPAAKSGHGARMAAAPGGCPRSDRSARATGCGGAAGRGRPRPGLVANVPPAPSHRHNRRAPEHHYVVTRRRERSSWGGDALAIAR